MDALSSSVEQRPIECFILNQPFICKAKIFLPRDNKMIQNLYFEQPSTSYELFGKVNVSLTGCKIAGWMIVGQDDTARKLFQRSFKYDFGIGNGARHASLANVVFLNNTICPV